MAADAAATPDQTTVALSCWRSAVNVWHCTLHVDDTAFEPRDNFGNVVKLSAAVTLHVVSEQMMVYSMTLENVDICLLNKHARTTNH